MDFYASKHEVLVKTEPYLKFKKELFKYLLETSKVDEELLRRKFYKLLESYLSEDDISDSDYKGIDVKEIVKKLDRKFKSKKEGSFIVQGNSIGYIKNKEPFWVRFHMEDTDKEIKTFLWCFLKL